VPLQFLDRAGVQRGAQFAADDRLEVSSGSLCAVGE
jgi:hypothetical protein